MTQYEAFRASIEAFLEESGMSPTAFGREAVKDPNFVSDVRSGRKPNLEMVDRINAFMAAHREEEPAQ